MTTIAATLEAMSGDRMVFDDAKGTWYPTIKLRKTKEAIFGAAGDAGDTTRFLDWAETDFNPKKRPKFEEAPGQDESAILLMLNAEGIHMMATSDPYPEKVADGTYAIGSGGKAAWAALLSGKTLLEAMEIAHAVDPYTRPPFDIFKLK